LRTFNIYGDNPCCILTQEESKKFIQGQEKEKYEFFLKVAIHLIVR
jgi:predicted HTH domain antitoxin